MRSHAGDISEEGIRLPVPIEELPEREAEKIYTKMTPTPKKEDTEEISPAETSDTTASKAITETQISAKEHVQEAVRRSNRTRKPPVRLNL
ncbi:hypothetical protein QE152_g38245 [Popillia japonica]|uniref:Uncharacterized protein n=1 Tax=Popillia japonica TaxID=7064 RepID=A0AAW1I6X1_POPJA